MKGRRCLHHIELVESLGKLPGNPVNPVKKNSGKMCCVLVGSIAALLQSGAAQLRPKEMQKKIADEQRIKAGREGHWSPFLLRFT